ELGKVRRDRRLAFVRERRGNANDLVGLDHAGEIDSELDVPDRLGEARKWRLDRVAQNIGAGELSGHLGARAGLDRPRLLRGCKQWQHRNAIRLERALDLLG